MSTSREMRETIVKGMAEIFWADAWASHVDEHKCCRLSGCQIEIIMPTVPDLAKTLAERTAIKIELLNHLPLDDLLSFAYKVDGMLTTGEEIPIAYAASFGHSLAFMAIQHGVSWFDNHVEFDLIVPRIEISVDLIDYADSTCDFEQQREQRT